MTTKRIALELFRSRPEASFIGYIPVFIVVVLFTLMGLSDEGFVGMLHFFALLIICIAQLKFRTLAGWLLLLGVSAWYTFDVILHPGNAHGQWLDYVVFTACGAIPAIALLIFRPRLKTRVPVGL